MKGQNLNSEIDKLNDYNNISVIREILLDCAEIRGITQDEVKIFSDLFNNAAEENLFDDNKNFLEISQIILIFAERKKLDIYYFELFQLLLNDTKILFGEYKNIKNAVISIVKNDNLIELIKILDNDNCKKQIYNISKILLRYLTENKISIEEFRKKSTNWVVLINKIDPNLRKNSKSLFLGLLDYVNKKFNYYHKKNIRDITDLISSLESDKEIIQSINQLKEYGTSLNQTNFDDISLLHMAVVYRRMNVVKFLLEDGADINLEIEYIEENSGNQTRLSPLDHVSYSMRDSSEYDHKLFIELMSNSALPNFRIMPNDVNISFINECRKNAPIIENKIFNEISQKIFDNNDNSASFNELMMQYAMENIFLVQYNEPDILKNKIANYCENYFNSKTKDKIYNHHESYLCDELNNSKSKNNLRIEISNYFRNNFSKFKDKIYNYFQNDVTNNNDNNLNLFSTSYNNEILCSRINNINTSSTNLLPKSPEFANFGRSR